MRSALRILLIGIVVLTVPQLAQSQLDGLLSSLGELGDLGGITDVLSIFGLTRNPATQSQKVCSLKYWLMLLCSVELSATDCNRLTNRNDRSCCTQLLTICCPRSNSGDFSTAQMYCFNYKVPIVNQCNDFISNRLPQFLNSINTQS